MNYPRLGRCDCPCSLIREAQYATALAWWPGFLPFTAFPDGPPDTYPNEHRGNPYARLEVDPAFVAGNTLHQKPFVARKFLEYEFTRRIEGPTLDQTDTCIVRWHPSWGDLDYFSFQHVDARTPGASFGGEWSPLEGPFRSSALRALLGTHGVGIQSPDALVWPYNGNVPSSLDFTRSIPVNPTEHHCEGGITLGADDAYSESVTIELRDPLDFDFLAERAAEMIFGPLTAVHFLQPADTFVAVKSGYDWFTCGTAGATKALHFGYPTEMLPLGIDAENHKNGVNALILARRRQSGDIVKFASTFQFGGVPGNVAAHGSPQNGRARDFGFLDTRGIPVGTDWWDWPQSDLAVLAVASAIKLPAGLVCGSLDDFISLWQVNASTGLRLAPICGPRVQPAGEYIFDPSLLRDLPTLDHYGDAWLGNTLAVARPNCCP